jgi:hypothetical protein
MVRPEFRTALRNGLVASVMALFCGACTNHVDVSSCGLMIPEKPGSYSWGISASSQLKYVVMDDGDIKFNDLEVPRDARRRISQALRSLDSTTATDCIQANVFQGHLDRRQASSAVAAWRAAQEKLFLALIEASQASSWEEMEDSLRDPPLMPGGKQ